MKPSINAINLIKEFEGYKDKSYLCVASKWTIGFGSTMWNDGKPVKQGEKITMQGAENLLLWELNKKMNTLYVIFINKRLKDLKWLVQNKHKFPNLEGEKLYKLLRLRDILDNK
jgi:GH24 family phage-related lysozyme (muramidase)